MKNFILNSILRTIPVLLIITSCIGMFILIASILDWQTTKTFLTTIFSWIHIPVATLGVFIGSILLELEENGGGILKIIRYHLRKYFFLIMGGNIVDLSKYYNELNHCTIQYIQPKDNRNSLIIQLRLKNRNQIPQALLNQAINSEVNRMQEKYKDIEYISIITGRYNTDQVKAFILAIKQCPFKPELIREADKQINNWDELLTDLNSTNPDMLEICLPMKVGQ